MMWKILGLGVLGLAAYKIYTSEWLQAKMGMGAESLEDKVSLDKTEIVARKPLFRKKVRGVEQIKSLFSPRAGLPKVTGTLTATPKYDKIITPRRPEAERMAANKERVRALFLENVEVLGKISKREVKFSKSLGTGSYSAK